MTTLKEHIFADLDDAFLNTDEFAREVIYNNGTTDVTINGVVDYGAAGQGSKAEHATITVKKSDVPNPEYRQTFTIDGVVWYIASDKDKGLALEGDEYMWVIRIQKNERFNQWRK